ncbi:MAG: hypothetical protein B6241_07865 [Spirochaetaceae bacterium 4572_59]|nr:MAG: hypothetical protein B6241_07865 [Spirochaetaceae bacterium 4572_59]
MSVTAIEKEKKDLYSYRVMKDERVLVYKDRKLIKMFDSETSNHLISNLNGKSILETDSILAKAAGR